MLQKIADKIRKSNGKLNDPTEPDMNSSNNNNKLVAIKVLASQKNSSMTTMLLFSWVCTKERLFGHICNQQPRK